MKTRDFLFEIGVEELPASYVARAMEFMPETLAKILDEQRIAHGEIRSYGTPRRLAVLVSNVAEEQPDLSEEIVGPPKNIAFDATGKPTKAGEGFAKKQGLGADALYLLQNEKGEYAAVRKEAKGQPARDVLAAILDRLVRSIPFQKSMRWGDGTFSFGRPIKWFVTLFGNEVVPFSFAGIEASRSSMGHRFLSEGPVELPSASVYVETMRKAHVLVDTSERRQTMLDALEAAAKSKNATWVHDEFLIEENLSLVEYPFVLAGNFEDRFLRLPDEVIISVMRGHQRYFAARPQGKTEGGLLPTYFVVLNTALSPETVIHGNDRVLRARLSDAAFFVDEDLKVGLSARGEKLDRVVFQAKLGTVGEKVERISNLAFALSASDSRVTPAEVKQAALLCKNDLMTYIVGEFPELQGLMGREYALQEKASPRVADAMRDHYLPKGASDVVAQDPLAAWLAVADRLDTLVGCFGIGMEPSGSQDPFALRRAAMSVIRTALEGPIDIDLKLVLGRAVDTYRQQGKKLSDIDTAEARLIEFFRSRLRVSLSENYPAEVVEACLAAWGSNSIRDLKARVEALAGVRGTDEFALLATAFKRASNITKDIEAKVVDATLLEDGAERELHAAAQSVNSSLRATNDYPAALKAIGETLAKPIDRFFTEVFVMAEDTRVRENRLSLLRGIVDSVNSIAHLQYLGGA